MLTHLSIQGLAIIERLTIDFTTGFNVITGETGAGKSILIKALSLLLGGKASHDCVRRGCDQAAVTGKFLIKSGHPALELLKAWGVTWDLDRGQAVVSIKRVITQKGRSSAWVNELPVTTGSLKDLASTLIDVFGQHDSHRLLDHHHHTTCLDQFVEPKSLTKDFHDAYAKASETMQKLRQFVDEATGKGRDLDYLSFRLTELSEFKPEPQDFAEVKSLTERAKLAAGVAAALRKAQGLMDDDSGDSVARRLREVSRALGAAKSSDLDDLAGLAAKIAGDIDDLSFSLGRAAGKLELSEDDIDQAESRIAGYQSLFRKHNVQTLDDLMTSWSELREQVSALENAAGHVASLLSKLSEDVSLVVKTSQNLATARRKASAVVTSRVEKELSDLAMPSAKFSVEFSEASRSIPSLDLLPFGEEAVAHWSDVLDDWTSVSESGSERAEFYLAANKGEPSLPLSKVASGGEVSRIMLALKKALVVGAETCVLVFDEIDTGISGRVADIVGQKIAELAGFCQIICISHLPQVAAYADRHYIVKKIEGKDRTESTITQLSKTERLEEIARLLSGDKVTKASLDHAKSLVTEAHGRGEARRKKLQSEVVTP
jgi:DNA repair protein RecN (Recombination protein N)